MRPIAIHQVVPSAIPGDATTSHTLELQRLLRDLGYSSEVYALAVHPELESRVRLLHEIGRSRNHRRLFVYQLASQSPVVDWLIGRPEPVAVNYHNVTPPRFLERWDPSGMLALRQARAQAGILGRHGAFGICDSAVNESDLRELGWSETAVAPVLVDFDAFDVEPDAGRLAALERIRELGGSTWLCVGSITPHKAQHRVLQAFAAYRAAFDSHAHLAVVGRFVTPSYAAALGRYVAELGLGHAVELTGGVSHAELAAFYSGSDVVVSMSEHEGFWVPALEAFHHHIPVVAYGAGAVAETVGPGGLVIRDNGPCVPAASVARLHDDSSLRERLARGAVGQLERFSLERSRAAMAEAIEGWVQRVEDAG